MSDTADFSGISSTANNGEAINYGLSLRQRFSPNSLWAVMLSRIPPASARFSVGSSGLRPTRFRRAIETVKTEEVVQNVIDEARRSTQPCWCMASVNPKGTKVEIHERATHPRLLSG